MRGTRFSLLLSLIAIGLGFIVCTPETNAQSATSFPSYWQYSASGRVDAVVEVQLGPADNRVFALVTANQRVELVRGNGTPVWEEALPFDEPIQAVHSFADGVVVATDSKLQLVGLDQTPIWEQTLGGISPAKQLIVQTHSAETEYLLVQHENGTLQQYNASGEQQWLYQTIDPPSFETSGQLAVVDLDADGQTEALYSYSTNRGFSRVDIVDINGETRWSEAVDRVVTAVEAGQFNADDQPMIAIGNNGGTLTLLNAQKQQLWTPRTLNRPIVDLLFTEWQSGQQLLIAATDIGKLIAYDESGRRVWDKAICNRNGRLQLQNLACENGIAVTIRAIDAPVTRSAQSLVALALLVDDGGRQQILSLDRSHNIVDQIETLAIAQQPLLTDTNGDGTSELALPSFGSLDLLSTATSARSTQELANQSYSLGAEPTVFLAHDFYQDGTDDLILGGKDGRLHHINPANNAENWILARAGYTVADVGLLSSQTRPNDRTPSLPSFTRQPDNLIVVYNRSAESDPTIDAALVELRLIDGSEGWETPLKFNARVNELLILEAQNVPPALVFALENGRLAYYALQIDALDNPIWQPNDLTWAAIVGESAEAVALLQHPLEAEPRLVATSNEQIRRYTLRGTVVDSISIESTSNLCQSAAELLMLIEIGSIAQQTCLNDLQLDDWKAALGAPLSASPLISTERYSYRPIDEQTWQQTTLRSLDSAQDQLNPSSVEFGLLNNVTAFYASDLMGRGQTDVAWGNEDGTVRIDLNNSAESQLSISAAVHGIVGLHTTPSNPANLAIIGENSRVSFFQFQPNYPPLLTTPLVTNDDQYSIQLDIFDIESQSIAATIEVKDPETNEWQVGETKTETGRFSTVEWVLEPPTFDQSVEYRIRYQDGDDHLLLFEPPPGPVPISQQVPTTYLTPASISGLIGVVALSLVGMFVWRQPTSQARRFYARLQRTPPTILNNLRDHYNETSSGSKLFVNLATIARQHQDEFVASLADGLYLLAERPVPGLQILNSVLADHNPTQTIFQLDEWQTMFGATQALMQATSTAELTLLRPELERLLTLRDHHNNLSGVFPKLVPSFTSLQDSTRVTTPDDRLAFLNDAASLLQRLSNENKRAGVYLTRILVAAITTRWQTLVATEIETLRGRARLEARLVTTRLAPTETAQLIVEIANLGQATAEDVQVTLLHDVITATNGATQRIQSVSPTTKRTVRFEIQVPSLARFRLAFQIVYNDRQRTAQTFEYANMVTVLTPNKAFAPITNPYSPGTPLRRDSELFFGRTPLFNFIAREAERVSQQHVLILVGQRRTGKTSALLRLNRHLPDHLIPIYIDCQSLGVLPGMTAFFQDVAWLISDVLLEYDVYIEVPDLDELNQNPGQWFQHRFIPAVRDQLLPHTKLVLVFDEFEALENLTADKILPRTIFPYLRHLMQHGEGLSFIFVGTHKLEEMTTDYWSVLFNIALYQSIDFLDEGAALDLMTKPVAPNLVYDDLAINKIWRLTAGHPYFLQLVCYSLVKRANEQKTSYVTILDVNKTVSEMLGLGEVHFAYIWQRSTAAERAVLIAIAHLLDKELPFRTAALVEILEPYKTELTPAQLTAALEKLVQRNILTMSHDGVQTQYELKVGLVGAWIEQSKSVAQLAQEQI